MAKITPANTIIADNSINADFNYIRYPNTNNLSRALFIKPV